MASFVMFFSKSKGEEERMLSNFSPAKVQYKGVLFPSIENAFQGAKFAYSTRPELFEEMALVSPAEAKSAGSKSGMKHLNARLKDLAGWDRDCVGIMKQLVAARMETDEKYRAAVEGARRDGTVLLHFERSGANSLWGGYFPKGHERTPECFVGCNMLGKILSGHV